MSRYAISEAIADSTTEAAARGHESREVVSPERAMGVAAPGGGVGYELNTTSTDAHTVPCVGHAAVRKRYIPAVDIPRCDGDTPNTSDVPPSVQLR